jgi:hypothetical protein
MVRGAGEVGMKNEHTIDTAHVISLSCQAVHCVIVEQEPAFPKQASEILFFFYVVLVSSKRFPILAREIGT